MKNETFRRRTVRVLIEECGLTPIEAGREYSLHTKEYNHAANYYWPDETWEDAREDIVRVYWRLK